MNSQPQLLDVVITETLPMVFMIYLPAVLYLPPLKQKQKETTTGASVSVCLILSTALYFLMCITEIRDAR